MPRDDRRLLAPVRLLCALTSAAACAGAAACGSPDAFLEVRVPIDPQLGLDQLRITLEGSELEPRSATAPEPRKLLDADVSAGFSLPPGYVGVPVSVEVEAFAGGVSRGLLVARGEGTVTPHRAELMVVEVPLTTVFVCGDGVVESIEACDDGNTVTGDGCTSSCAVEPICGDGLLSTEEGCDDGARADGDGCSTACIVEAGWLCDGGEPTVCGPICGDGIIVGAEGCDDGGRTSGDGCDASCGSEVGYECQGAPSWCGTVCGDGIQAGVEACDEGSANDDTVGDRCRADCTLPFCGDLVADTGSGEGCDDGNTDNADGCLTGCIAPTCGDGFVLGGEACDDGNPAPGDGCDATCAIEPGFECGGNPSWCGLTERTHVVAPTGGDFTSLTAALQSQSVISGDLLLVAAGTYVDAPDFVKSVAVVAAPGAALVSTVNHSATLTVGAGANVVIQGLTVAASGREQTAVRVLDPLSRLSLVDTVVGPATGVGIEAGAGTRIDVQRSVIAGNSLGGIEARGTYAVENSVLRQNATQGARFAAGSAGTFRFNTLVGNASGVVCEVPASVEASILHGNLTADAAGLCDLSTSLVGVDPALGGDGFHLEASSVALDAAGLACPAVDFDRDPRPLGAACEPGADERPDFRAAAP